MNALNAAIPVTLQNRLVVIMDCLALNTMYLDKEKQSMKFAGTIG